MTAIADPGTLPVPAIPEPPLAQTLIDHTVHDTKHRSAALDALRAVAALMVVGMHTLLLAPEPAHPNAVLHLVRSHLWTGVDIFFALSGFLIAGPFLRALLSGSDLPDRSGYVARRVARIVPGYWLALTVVIICYATGLINPAIVGTNPLSGTQILSHYLFIHNWFPGESRDLFVVAWTLAIEIFFYLCVPIAATLLRRKYKTGMRRETLVRWIIGAALFSFAWAFAWGLAFDHIPLLHRHLDDWRTVITDNLPSQLALFCPGMLLAVLFAKTSATQEDSQRWWIKTKPSILFAAAVFFWLVAIAAGSHGGRAWDAVRDSLFMPIACGFPLLIFLRGGPVIKVISRFLAPIGVISYGVYLWHWTVGAVAGNWFAHFSVQLPGGQWFAWILAFLLLCAFTLPLAGFSWFVIERPALRATADWAGRRVKRLRQAA